MAETESVAAEAGVDRVRALHEQLVLATAGHDSAPHELLSSVAGQLPADAQAGLPPRERVAIRLLRANALDAAWAVLRDNAVGVTAEELAANTSSGAPRTAWRLPLLTCIEPPRVFAWLPGFRDPRFAAPDDAYDITDLVRTAAHLDELWWDGPRLVLAGWAQLRHLPATAYDQVSLVLRRSGGAEVVLPADRLRRADLVTGGVDTVRDRAWTGWAARVDLRRLRPSGLWKFSLRVAAHGIVAETRLGGRRGDAVPSTSWGRAGMRRASHHFADDRRLDLLLVDPLVVRAPRRVLHLVARSAPER